MTSFKQVREVCRVLRSRGLLGEGEACRVALVACLMSTLAPTESEPAVAAVPGESLGGALGLSRVALKEQVEHLRSLGFALESAAGDGYRLARPFTDLVVAEAVLPLLLEEIEPTSPWIAGLPYSYRARCESTNLVLKKAARFCAAGALVVTDEQTEGRGRLGRTWVSGSGEDLTFSVLLRPSVASGQVTMLSLAAALAVAEVLEDLLGLSGQVRVKWPNDVLLGEKKVCGILLESSMADERVQWAIAGVGLNVNSDPSALLAKLTAVQRQEWRGRPQPTSLRECSKHKVDRGPLLARLLAQLTRRWAEAGTPDLIHRLRTRDALVGRRVEVFAGPPDNEPVVAGEAQGIGSEGQLLVRCHDGVIVPVYAGEVTVSSQPLTAHAEGG
jgi:BirA family biotin operon repressor/biotin-[acetyl-CoA-carboxylase] ligase